MYVIVVGNPFDGLTIYGPYEDEDEAIQYAELWIRGYTWHVVTIEDPNKFKS